MVPQAVPDSNRKIKEQAMLVEDPLLYQAKKIIELLENLFVKDLNVARNGKLLAGRLNLA